MEENRFYFHVEELADYWQYSVPYVMQLGLTNQLQFMALADWECPDRQIKLWGEHTPLTYQELSEILSLNEPKVKKYESAKNGDGIFKGDTCFITYHPGIDRLIIQVEEVKRFDAERTNSSATQGNHDSNVDLQQTIVAEDDKAKIANEIIELGRKLKQKYPNNNTTDFIWRADELKPYLKKANNSRHIGIIAKYLIKAGIPAGKGRGHKSKPLKPQE